MQIVRDIAALPEEAKGCALAIGNFDGVHQGHSAVLRDMLQQARERRVPSAVMTFEPHPRRFFAKNTPAFMIEPFHVKARRLRAMGVDYHIAVRFNQALSGLHADAFIDHLLVDKLGVSHVTTGDNFLFGHKRSGDASRLHRAAEKGKFTYHALTAVRAETQAREMTCSSTHIRQFLEAGDVESANNLLGRPYELVGRVQHGDQRGRELGFPTANMTPSTKLFLPHFGVYVVRFAVMNALSYDSADEKALQWYDGVANLGLRPTFKGKAPRLEVHGFDFAREIYGERVRVQLRHYLRNEHRFDGVEALKAQIIEDEKRARVWLTNNPK